MKPNRWIDASRRLYAHLLNLYPKEHRAEYGPSMQQVFYDQCRAAYAKSSFGGLLLLWPRILLDLITSSLREHLAVPDVTAGLLEAPPNRPLPWKGVALVIIPGLVFLICQIGQLTGKDWFFWATRRSGFLFIIPVLVVWAIKRKFPIWGLIPLGVLYSAFLGFGYRLRFASFGYVIIDKGWLKYPFVKTYMEHVKEIQEVVVVVILVTSLLLLWLISRRQKISRRAWAWLGVYGLLWLPTVVSFLKLYSIDSSWIPPLYPNNPPPIMVIRSLINFSYAGFYFRAAFLLLIMLGSLLARRHGRLAILLPLGYLLPIVVYGGYYDLPPDWPLFILAISAAILIYRFLLTIMAPIWIVRSGSESTQRRASLIGLWSLVGIQAVMVIVRFAVRSSGLSFDFLSYVNYVFSDQLYLLAGIALAINLYQPKSIPQPEPETGKPQLEFVKS